MVCLVFLMECVCFSVHLPFIIIIGIPFISLCSGHASLLGSYYFFNLPQDLLWLSVIGPDTVSSVGIGYISLVFSAISFF